MNPFTNLNNELKSAMQDAINKLGPAFWNEQSFYQGDGFGTTITWSEFGFESVSFYQVSVYTKVLDLHVCNKPMAST
jgi:hypothetical protein